MHRGGLDLACDPWDRAVQHVQTVHLLVQCGQHARQRSPADGAGRLEHPVVQHEQRHHPVRSRGHRITERGVVVQAEVGAEPHHGSGHRFIVQRASGPRSTHDVEQ